MPTPLSGLLPGPELITNGCDIVFQTYRRGEELVELAWDNWTDFTVVAKTPASEPLVRDIGAWLQSSHWAAVSSGKGVR
jgi:hypothetical protein